MMKKIKLNKDEMDILKAFEAGTLKPVKDGQLKDTIIQAAKRKIAKTKSINIRISENDLNKIKEKAVETGIPYQTLIGSVLHQYAEDKIKVSI